MVTHLTKGYAAVTGIVGGVQLHVYRHQFLVQLHGTSDIRRGSDLVRDGSRNTARRNPLADSSRISRSMGWRSCCKAHFKASCMSPVWSTLPRSRRSRTCGKASTSSDKPCSILAQSPKFNARRASRSTSAFEFNDAIGIPATLPVPSQTPTDFHQTKGEDPLQ